MSRSRARHSPSIERAFINDEIDKINTQIRYTKRAYKCQWAKIRNFSHLLTYFDFAATIRRLISGLKMLLKKSTTGTFSFCVRNASVAC